ncbi:MAG: WbuC family cupin fold metalloprotein [Sulfuricellaceae bacterium]
MGKTPIIVDSALLDSVSAQAAAAPRRRKNHNFHTENAAPCHRLLNGIEPDSYVAPHCHAAADKDESILALRGKMGLVFFDESGNVTTKAVIEPNGAAVAVDIPHGVFHTVVALVDGSLFFEAKAGPYHALTPEERAPWAPMEGAPEAAAYLEKLKKLF